MKRKTLQKKLCTVLVLLSPKVYACSFASNISPILLLVIALLLISVSLWLLYRCFPNRKSLIGISLIFLLVSPLVFVVINWDLWYPCNSNLDLYAALVVLVSSAVILISVICALWRYFKTQSLVQK